jgi:hypothetical protein
VQQQRSHHLILGAAQAGQSLAQNLRQSAAQGSTKLGALWLLEIRTLIRLYCGAAVPGA